MHNGCAIFCGKYGNISFGNSLFLSFKGFSYLYNIVMGFDFQKIGKVTIFIVLNKIYYWTVEFEYSYL